MTGIPNFQSLQQPAISSLGKQPSSGKMPQPTLLFGGDLEDRLRNRKSCLDEEKAISDKEKNRIEHERQRAARNAAGEKALEALDTVECLPNIKPIELLQFIDRENDRRGACLGRPDRTVRIQRFLEFFAEQDHQQVEGTLRRFKQLGLLYHGSQFYSCNANVLFITDLGHDCLRAYKRRTKPESDGFWAMLKWP